MSNMPPPPPPPSGYSSDTVGTADKKNGLGIAALVLGILSILALVTVVGATVLGLIAVILGFIARGRVKRGEADNGGVALAGIITGFIGLLGSILVIVAVVAFLGDDVENLNDCLDGADTQAEQDQCAEDFADDLIGG